MLVNIYTTYFANLKKIPEDVIPISISLKPPKGYKGLAYSKLFPTEEIIRIHKKDGDDARYIREYTNQVLNKLNPYDVLRDLNDMAIEATGDKTGGLKIALVCYEKPEDFCHRKLVARWFKAINIPVKEL